MRAGWPIFLPLGYAALFDVINPGLGALGLPMPLGGTSNHFRTDLLRRVVGWDAWNVTEDADLGLRFARFGYRVETIDAATFEDAPVTISRWLGQRARWMKGWMQTLAVFSARAARAICARWAGSSALSALRRHDEPDRRPAVRPLLRPAPGRDLFWGDLLAPPTFARLAFSSAELERRAFRRAGVRRCPISSACVAAA